MIKIDKWFNPIGKWLHRKVVLLTYSIIKININL
jgi:hypothetical protein